MTELFVLLIKVKTLIIGKFQNYAQFLKMGGLGGWHTIYFEKPRLGSYYFKNLYKK